MKLPVIGASLGGLIGYLKSKKNKKDERENPLEDSLRGSAVGGLTGLGATLGDTYGLKGGYALGEMVSDDLQTKSNYANIARIIGLLSGGTLGYMGGKKLVDKEEGPEEEKSAMLGTTLGAVYGSNAATESEVYKRKTNPDVAERSGALRGAGIGAIADIFAALGLTGGKSLGTETARQLEFSNLGPMRGLGGLLGAVGGGVAGYGLGKKLLWPEEWSADNTASEIEVIEKDMGRLLNRPWSESTENEYFALEGELKDLKEELSEYEMPKAASQEAPYKDTLSVLGYGD